MEKVMHQTSNKGKSCALQLVWQFQKHNVPSVDLQNLCS